MIINKMLYNIKFIFFKIKWKKLNKNNFTFPKKIFDIRKVQVGNMSYGPIDVHEWNDDKESLIIGNYVSISWGVKFVLGGNHNMCTLSSYPFKVMILGGTDEAWSKGKIKIEDDVWIGMDCIILSGVKVGRGAVIGAGSVVASDIPPYAVVVGNPARIVKYRIPKELIDDVSKFDFNKLNDKFIRDNIHLLYSKLDESILNKLKNK